MREEPQERLQSLAPQSRQRFGCNLRVGSWRFFQATCQARNGGSRPGPKTGDGPGSHVRCVLLRSLEESNQGGEDDVRLGVHLEEGPCGSRPHGSQAVSKELSQSRCGVLGRRADALEQHGRPAALAIRALPQHSNQRPEGSFRVSRLNVGQGLPEIELWRIQGVLRFVLDEDTDEGRDRFPGARGIEHLHRFPP